MKLLAEDLGNLKPHRLSTTQLGAGKYKEEQLTITNWGDTSRDLHNATDASTSIPAKHFPVNHMVHVLKYCPRNSMVGGWGHVTPNLISHWLFLHSLARTWFFFPVRIILFKQFRFLFTFRTGTCLLFSGLWIFTWVTAHLIRSRNHQN